MDFKFCLGPFIVIVWAAVIPTNYAFSGSRSMTSQDVPNLLKIFGGVANLGPDLTEGEKSALVKFHLKVLVDAVRGRLPLQESYDDQFLLRFLSAKNFVADEAYQALEEHMTWREEMERNSILEPDWSDMEERFPYDMFLMHSAAVQDGVTLYIPICKWNMPNIEDSVRFLQYSTFKMMEDVSRYARLLAELLKSTGRDSSKFHIIVDLKGCRASQGKDDVGALMELVAYFGGHYKEATKHVIFINEPNFSFTCAWSTDGILTCPNKSESANIIWKGLDVLNKV